MSTTEKKRKRRGNGRSPRARTRARAKDRFIRRLAESGNVADSCRKARLPQRTAYDLRKSDPAFAALWKEAEEISIDGLEDEARRRGVEGWDEPVYQKGVKVGTVRRHSDRMLEILLKGHRPKFRENQVAVQVNVGEQRELGQVDRENVLLETARSMGFVMYQAAEIQRERALQKLLPAPCSPAVQERSEKPVSSYETGAATGADTSLSMKQPGDSAPQQAAEPERIVDHAARLSEQAEASASMRPDAPPLQIAANRYRRRWDRS